MANSLMQDGEFSTLEAKIVKCWRSDHVIYDLEITASTQNIVWTLSRRYSEFLSLHDHLCKVDPSVKAIPFPPKKSFNNLDSKFISQRRQDLERYFNAILQKFPVPPSPLSVFIDWHLYEIHGITNALAKRFFENGDLIVMKGFQFEFSALQIFAINERLQSQSPTNLYNEPNTDFVHVMEFIGRVRNVKVTGSTTSLNASNIIINKLEFDMSRFVSLEKLELDNVDLRLMRGFDRLKEVVRHLKVCHCLDNIKALSLGDLLSLGNGDWVFGRDPVPTNCWSKVEVLDLSKNYLHDLDPSMTLFKRVRNLKLNDNLLINLRNLDVLENLRCLNVAQNSLGLHFLPGGPTLRGCLGNVTDLDLSGNGLASARLVEGLYSLVKLNLANNLIAKIDELVCLGSLPCLESLILLGNPVCSVSGYRRSTLQLFGDRFNQVRLDLRQADDAEFLHLRAVTSVAPEGPRGGGGGPGDLEVSIEAEANEIIIF